MDTQDSLQTAAQRGKSWGPATRASIRVAAGGSKGHAGALPPGPRGPLSRQRRVLDRLVASLPVPPPAGDPVFLVRPYVDPCDQEVAGLYAALFAYGRVKKICATVDWILRQLGPSPAEALRSGRHLKPGWALGFRYRFNTRRDLVVFSEAVARSLRREGSLGDLLAGHRAAGGGLESALCGFVHTLRKEAQGGIGDAAGRPAGLSAGLRFLLADPARGGACKRWWLYLRWMIRPDDGLDLGVWAPRFRPSELLIPLDAHWIRIGTRLGLTARKTPGLRMAREITAHLRVLRPGDPLFYDYAVCHLGIGGGCPPRLRRQDCSACPLRGICPAGPEASSLRTERDRATLAF